MDRLKIRRTLYASMGDDARRSRAEDMRKKYANVPPAMADAMAGEDEATEAAKLPDVGALKIDKMEDINNDDFQKAMSDLEEDDEMQKWMAKQKKG